MRRHDPVTLCIGFIVGFSVVLIPACRQLVDFEKKANINQAEKRQFDQECFHIKDANVNGDFGAHIECMNIHEIKRKIKENDKLKHKLDQEVLQQEQNIMKEKEESK
jgi:hypothetical protein